MPGLGAAFVHGCLLPEQLPCHGLLPDSSCQGFMSSCCGYLLVAPRCSQNISKKYPGYSLEGMQGSEAERRPSGGMKYIQMSPSMQGITHFFYRSYRGCQQRTFLGAGDPQRSMMSSRAASTGWILSLVRSVLPGACLDVCRNFYKLVCLSEQSKHDTLCVFWVK